MRRALIFVLALAIVSGSCGGSAPSTTTAPGTTASTTTTTMAPTTSTTTTTEPPAPTTAPIAPDVSACRLPEQAWVGVGLGFPRSQDRLRSTGSVEVIVLFADFGDVAATESPDAVFGIISPAAEEFFATVSYGRFDLHLEPHLEWLHLSGPATSYADAIRTFDGHRDFVQEAIDLADPSVDFAGADAVVVVAAPNAAAVGYGPTWTGGDFAGGVLDPDGASITNAITSGADLTYWGGLWLPHEMGHSLTLADLYSYDGLPGFTGDFSLMNDIGGEAPEYLAYERWLLGWLDDDQILCTSSDSTALLSPIEAPGGPKAIIVPVGPTRAIVVESRRSIGYDDGLTRPGAIVYLVDTSIASGYGPIEVLNDRRALTRGESISVEGVTIEIVDATDEGDTVRVGFSG